MAALDISDLGILELLSGFRARSFSPAEVMSGIATRIEECEPAVGAVVTNRLAAAATEADRATDRYRRPAAADLRPLEGIPFMAKDLIDTAQLPTRLGFESWPGRQSSTDATAVARLRGAGAILVAKAATHQLGLGVTCASRDFPARTRNPWDLSLCAGGSSGGSAVAVATGEAPLALGTDTAGSIRTPADFCGVFGLRPTFGSVSGSGIQPIAPSVDQVGPIARSPQDLAIAFDCLTGLVRPGHEVEHWDVPGSLEGLRFGLSRDLDGGLADAERLRWTECAAGYLQARGASVEELSLPRTRSAHEILGLTISAALRSSPPPDRPLQSEVSERFLRAQEAPPQDLALARRRRRELVAELAAALGRVDVLLSPAAGRGAVPVTEGGGSSQFRAAVMACSAPQSLAGLPAVAVPIAAGPDGLPVGVQLSGRRGSEQSLLRLAAVTAWLGRPVPAASDLINGSQQTKGNERD